MTSKMITGLALLISYSAFAAPMRTPKPVITSPLHSNIYEDVKTHLAHSPEKRSLVLRTMGKEAKQALADISFEKTESLGTRWKALVTMGRLDPKFAQPHLESALESNEWFMRNAALVVVSYGDRAWAIKKARIALHDPALVVRTAAVKVLGDVRAREAMPLLWEKMNASENFRRGESLWIRPIIGETLAMMARPEDKAAFEKLLSDRDPRVKIQAQAGLNKINGVKID